MPMKPWTPEMQSLIERFRAIAPAPAPFRLAPWAMVEDPVKFHDALARDIEAGPGGPRGRLGGVESELKAYLAARGI